MNAAQVKDDPDLARMLRGLEEALGPKLRSVVLYGSAARGDYHKERSDLNLLLVLEDLELKTLQALGPPVARWRARGHHVPRLFTPASLVESADVFPIEFLDIRSGRLVLRGDDPFARLDIRTHQLRLQCERELREKLMRLQEGYVEGHARRRDLDWLLSDSYGSFVALFRGCLRLLGVDVPPRNHEVVAAFCARAGLDPAPFEEIERLRRGEGAGLEPKATFARYYEQLMKAVRVVDRFQTPQGGAAR